LIGFSPARRIFWKLTYAGAAMPKGGELPPSQAETPAGLREMASTAQRFASQLRYGDPGSVRLLEFAEELEARAAALRLWNYQNQSEAEPAAGIGVATAVRLKCAFRRSRPVIPA
jgi:hypothetical protein